MVKVNIIYVLVIALSLVNGSSGTDRKQSNGKNTDRVSDTRHGLTLMIRLDRKAYALGDVAAMTISLKNVGDRPIALLKDMGWGTSSSLSLQVADSNGKGLHKTFLDDARDHPPFADEEFTTIQSGEEFTMRRRLSLKSEGITIPSSYNVTVWYHSPVSKEFAPKGMEVWTTEYGVLQSRPATFQVTQ